MSRTQTLTSPPREGEPAGTVVCPDWFYVLTLLSVLYVSYVLSQSFVLYNYITFLFCVLFFMYLLHFVSYLLDMYALRRLSYIFISHSFCCVSFLRTSKVLCSVCFTCTISVICLVHHYNLSAFMNSFIVCRVCLSLCIIFVICHLSRTLFSYSVRRVSFWFYGYVPCLWCTLSVIWFVHCIISPFVSWFCSRTGFVICPVCFVYTL